MEEELEKLIKIGQEQGVRQLAVRLAYRMIGAQFAPDMLTLLRKETDALLAELGSKDEPKQ